METFLVVTNQQKDVDLSVTKSICSYLEEVKEKKAEMLVIDNRNYELSPKDLEGVDCLLVLGGDGTILRVAKHLVDSDLPIVGINMGHLGYLAEVDKENVTEALDALCNGEYTTENRMMLSGKVYKEGREVCSSNALNDIIISRGGSPQILNFEVKVNGKVLKKYRADGVILATPTGSTAYNLSAGGPIVEPGADMTLLTPISPHTMLSRSIVFNAEDEIEVTILSAHDAVDLPLCEVSFDGGNQMKLMCGDRVVVTKSSMCTNLIRLSSVSFLETLYEKMREE